MPTEVDIISPTGEVGTVPSDKVEGALSSGFSFPKGKEINVTSPTGEAGTIPAENASKAFKAGYKYQTPYSSTVEQDKAQLEGAAEGLLGPLAPLAETKLLGVDPKDIRGRREENPISHGAGQAVGLGLSALTGVGEARLLAGASRGITNLAGKLAVENALFQAGDEVSKLIINDPAQSASTAAANIGMAAVLGGGLGKASKEVSELWSIAKGSKTGAFLSEFKDRLVEHANTPGAVSKPGGVASKLADSLINKGLAKATGTVAGAIGGAMAGHPYIGALIGERALGHLSESAMPVLAKAIMGTEVNPTAFRTAAQYAVNVAKGEKLVNNAIEGLFKPGMRVAMPEAKDINKLQERLDNLQQSPDEVLDSTGDLGHYMPDHPSAVGGLMARTIGYLSSIKPGEDDTSIIGQPRVPTAIERSDYTRALNLAEQPLGIVQHIKDGTIVPKDITTMNAVHPELMKSLQDKAMNALVTAKSKGNRISYEMQMGLSLFLGQPLESSTMPQNIMANQMQTLPLHSPSAPAAGNGKQNKGISKAASDTMSKVSKTNQSAPQAREAQKLSRK